MDNVLRFDFKKDCFIVFIDIKRVYKGSGI